MVKLIASMILASVVGILSRASAAEEATEVKVTPVVIESLNFQYGDAQFGWQRIRTDDFQFETNQGGDVRFGPRGDLGKVGDVNVHGRLLAKLHNTHLAEIRPEVMFYKDGWYTFISVGVDTKSGATSLYDETVYDFVSDRNITGGIGLVHNGGLSGQKSTINLGPQIGIQLSKELSLDLHYGFAVTKNTPDEAWAIMRFRVQ